MKLKKVTLCVGIILLSHYANATDYNNPKIDSVLTTSGGGGVAAGLPNVFFTLDDSGSMKGVGREYNRISYNSSITYKVPPSHNGTPYQFGYDGYYCSPAKSGFQQVGAQTKPDRVYSNRHNNIITNGICGRDSSENYATWAQFYSSPALALQSSLAVAVAEAEFPLRIGYQTINTAAQKQHGIQSPVANQLLPLNNRPLLLDKSKGNYQANLQTFLSWLYQMVADGWTPLRPAVQKVKTELYSDYDNKKLHTGILDGDKCRQNFSIVFADGEYNTDDRDKDLAGDYDGKDYTWKLLASDNKLKSIEFKGENGDNVKQRLFTGGKNSLFQGTEQRPSSGVSDLALWSWKEDLDNNPKNNVLPPFFAYPDKANPGSDDELWSYRNDPANWQRMITYTIGFNLAKMWSPEQLQGLNGIDKSKQALEPFAQTLLNTSTSPGFLVPDWPWPPSPALDFIRAGYVGRGGYYDVRTGEDLGNVFNGILKDVETRSSMVAPSGGSVSNAQVTASSNSIMLTSQSDYEKRSGTVKGNWLYNGRPANSTPSRPGDADNCFGASGATATNYIGEMCTASGAKWSAADKLPDANNRKIFSYNGTAGVTLDEATVVGVAGLTPEQVKAYIKGDQSQEGTAVRKREAKGILGDIGHSGPVFVGDADNRVWNETPKKTRTQMVYVGANDGMLHGFDAGTGVEKFAYFPKLLLSEKDKLENLIKADQPHQAFVDGQITVQDIVDPDNSTDKTVLVAGLGAGGKGLFALDVTDPDSFDKTKVLWEFTDTNLGKVMGKPSIIRVEGTYQGKTDRWVVVVGTGYGNGSSSESGVLVLDAITGKKLQFLKLDGAQGVGEIAWIDHQKYPKVDDHSATYLSSNGYIGEMDRGYVGDLQGNLWVLDFAYDSGTTSTTLRSGLVDTDGKAQPLFKATDSTGTAQQITAGLVTAPHPSNRGTMVYFGTGDLFSASPLSNAQNSMYGIWDDFGENYGNIATKSVETYNKTRTRNYLTYYPWEQKEGVFADGTTAYYRQIGASQTSETALTTIVKQPITWANTGPYGDSKDVPTTSYNTAAMPSSGWVFDAKKGERISQKAYSIVNERGESGITFLLYSQRTGGAKPKPVASDSCGGGSPAEFFTWNMSMRTDIIDGPATPFSYAHTDSNQDGKIDAKDAVKASTTVANSLIPMGAVSGKATLGNTEAGEKGLISPPIATGSLGVTSGACSGGDIRTYKKLDENGNATEVRICIPRTASAYSEIE